jgi:hypothetical protein
VVVVGGGAMSGGTVVTGRGQGEGERGGLCREWTWIRVDHVWHWGCVVGEQRQERKQRRGNIISKGEEDGRRAG